MITLLRLMLAFCKTGLFAVGGGLATLPFIYEMSRTTGWFTAQDILNMVAVSESTPGAMGINMSTYVGFMTSGIPGAVLATLSLAAPSIVIIVIIAKGMERFKRSPIVQSVFRGLRPASTGLIVAAGLGVAKLAFFPEGDLTAGLDLPAAVLAVVLFALLRKCKLHPLVCIASAAVVGCVLQM
ncbi:chromate transporter [Pseudoflavonifractor sp. MSJ-37]|uniref:chromate transporter n=1 Tax=Pseudoflavonifractor sp. MSJ-37 TaxID=2841531 RepID=UPI001C1219F2|nr:chromate transporter [Pseudoflavonifractor sp. MSJ-37]MBU5436345.1 chromate transporter [Pseudoflavonifractor sp. MSJ-37]